MIINTESVGIVMNELTKVCSRCGVEKPLSEFHKCNGRIRSCCKPCEYKEIRRPYIIRNRDKVRKRVSIENKKYNSKNRWKINERAKIYLKKIEKCAKVFCPSLKYSKAQIISLVCIVCGKKYGMTMRTYKNRLRNGYTPKYCSNDCKFIGMTKKWQNTQSPYAKKIKELQKEYK